MTYAMDLRTQQYGKVSGEAIVAHAATAIRTQGLFIVKRYPNIEVRS
jgi:hypothetical protein